MADDKKRKLSLADVGGALVRGLSAGDPVLGPVVAELIPSPERRMAREQQELALEQQRASLAENAKASARRDVVQRREDTVYEQGQEDRATRLADLAAQRDDLNKQRGEAAGASASSAVARGRTAIQNKTMGHISELFTKEEQSLTDEDAAFLQGTREFNDVMHAGTVIHAAMWAHAHPENPEAIRLLDEALYEQGIERVEGDDGSVYVRLRGGEKESSRFTPGAADSSMVKIMDAEGNIVKENAEVIQNRYLKAQEALAGLTKGYLRTRQNARTAEMWRISDTVRNAQKELPLSGIGKGAQVELADVVTKAPLPERQRFSLLAMYDKFARGAVTERGEAAAQFDDMQKNPKTAGWLEANGISPVVLYDGDGGPADIYFIKDGHTMSGDAFREFMFRNTPTIQNGFATVIGAYKEKQKEAEREAEAKATSASNEARRLAVLEKSAEARAEDYEASAKAGKEALVRKGLWDAVLSAYRKANPDEDGKPDDAAVLSFYLRRSEEEKGNDWLLKEKGPGGTAAEDADYVFSPGATRPDRGGR